MNREKELQALLAEERERSEQRKVNYSRLKDEHIKLQKDFLTLTGELKTVLHEGKLKEERLTLQNDHLSKLLNEKDRMIDDLKSEIASRDPSVVREKLIFELKEPIRRLEIEKEQLEREKERISYELKVSQVKVNHLEKEITEAIERTKLTFESELNCLKKEKEQLKVTISELSKSPDNQKLTSLLEENSRLKSKLTQSKIALEESEFNYSKVYNRLESLVSQIESRDLENESILATLKNQINTSREESEEKDTIIRASKRELNSLTDHLERTQRQLNEASAELTATKSKYQSELEELSREKDTLKTQLTEVANEAAEYLKMRDRIRVEYEKLKECLDEERKDLASFKLTSENNLTRLRTCIQEERNVNANKISQLEKSLEELKKENSKLKSRVAHLTEIREKLTSKLKSIGKSISLVAAVAERSNVTTDGQSHEEAQISRSASHPVNLVHEELTEQKENHPKVTFSTKTATKMLPESLLLCKASDAKLNGKNATSENANGKCAINIAPETDKSKPQSSNVNRSTSNVTINRTNSIRDASDEICGCCRHCDQVNYPVHREKYLSYIQSKSSKKVPVRTSTPKKVPPSRSCVHEANRILGSHERQVAGKVLRRSSAPPDTRSTISGQLLDQVNTQGGTSFTILNDDHIASECHRNLKKQYSELRRKQQELSNLLNLTLKQTKT